MSKEPTKKQLRKMKRNAEAFLLAKEARFWRGVGMKTADRMGYSRPASTQASRILSKGKKKR